jgi:catechol 2,3-dioxygenase-like lactoylglutathione lyase family enzyme
VAVLTALDHAVIAVRDLEAAARTYTRLFGLAPSWHGDHPQLGTANILFRLENTYVELLSPRSEGLGSALVAAHLDQQGEGIFAIAFSTGDADACAATLRQRGLTVTDPIPGDGHDTRTGARRSWRSVHIPTTETRGVTIFVIQHESAPDALPLAQPAVPAAAAVRAFDHVVVFTSDVGAAQRLYGDQLGLRLALDRTFEQRRLRLLFFRIDGITVELAAPVDSRADASGPDHLYGLSYRVGDVDAARERVAAAGFDVSEVRPGMKPGTRVCTVRSPTHGVATLLIEPASWRKSG